MTAATVWNPIPPVLGSLLVVLGAAGGIGSAVGRHWWGVAAAGFWITVGVGLARKRPQHGN